MSEIISKDLVQERIDKYMENNSDIIIELIDKKIDAQVKKAVRDIFNYGWKNTAAAEIIDNRVSAKVELYAENLEIDDDWILEQVNKKFKTAVKNIEVKIQN